MGLVAHYKLDGNVSDALRKYNLQEYSNSGHLLPTTDAVMGQAYYRPAVNNSPAYFATTQTIHLAGSHTLACWAKVTGVHTGTANGLISYHSHTHNTGSGITVREISGSDYRISCNTGNGASRTFHSFYGTSNIKDRWCHLVFRFDAVEDKISLWVDGQKEFETTYNIVTRPDIIAVFAWSTTHLGNAQYRPAAYIDDVRVYDHALSEREIRDIAQAKVLHCDFDHFQEPTENKASGVTYSSYAPYHSISGDANRVTMVWATTNGFMTIRNFGTLQGNTITVSGYMKKNGVPYLPALDRIDTYQSATAIKHTMDSSTGRFEVTQVYTTSGDWLFHTPVTAAIGDVLTIDDFQVEFNKGYATPFVNGTRPGTVRDSSSQGNDTPLALATTPKWVEDSVLGKGCYNLEFGKYLSLPKSTLGKLSSCTISFWRKRTAAGSWIVGNNGNPTSGNYFMATTGGVGAFYHSSVGSPIIYRDGVLSTTPANDDEWHHYCLVGADLSTWNYLNINSYDISSGTWLFRGLIDDLRIYATALSADEVMELYRQRASIDSQGNLIC